MGRQIYGKSNLIHKRTYFFIHFLGRELYVTAMRKWYQNCHQPSCWSPTSLQVYSRLSLSNDKYTQFKSKKNEREIRAYVLVRFMMNKTVKWRSVKVICSIVTWCIRLFTFVINASTFLITSETIKCWTIVRHITNIWLNDKWYRFNKNREN